MTTKPHPIHLLLHHDFGVLLGHTQHIFRDRIDVLNCVVILQGAVVPCVQLFWS